MITIIAGSNNRKSKAFHFANHYYKTLKRKTKEVVILLDLKDLPSDMSHPDMYSADGQSPIVKNMQDQCMLPAQKFVFVIPEYNGSFPGVLKVFLDACSVREYSATFSGKKAALTGIASGRAGNIRGMDHLCDILHHLGTIVHPNKLPISNIESLIDEKGKIIDTDCKKALKKHMEDLLAF